MCVNVNVYVCVCVIVLCGTGVELVECLECEARLGTIHFQQT